MDRLAAKIDRWVRLLGLGFHPDTPGVDYVPALPPDAVKDYDADMNDLFATSEDPYADGIEGWRRAGLI